MTDKKALKLREIMEQAQVFASAWSLVGGRFDGGNAMDDAEVAKMALHQMIEEALAKQEQGEPFGWYDMEHGEIRDVEWNRLKPTYEGVWRPLYTTPQPKQEQGEPVAYIHRNEYNEYRLEPYDNFDIKSIPFNVDVPLFKPPQQRTWVGLTDEEIVSIANEVQVCPDWTKLFARAIEAKLKEKNT